jgi:hypothetical protein
MKDDKEEGGRPVHLLPLAWLSSSIFLFWFSSVCLRTDSFCAWWVSSSSLISADEQTKTEARLFSSRVFRLTLSDLFFETRADPASVRRRCVVLFDAAQLLARILFCFFSPQLFIFFYLLRCWQRRLHADSRNSFLTVQTGQEYIGFDGFNFFGLITPNDWKST